MTTLISIKNSYQLIFKRHYSSENVLDWSKVIAPLKATKKPKDQNIISINIGLTSQGYTQNDFYADLNQHITPLINHSKQNIIEYRVITPENIHNQKVIAVDPEIENKWEALVQKWDLEVLSLFEQKEQHKRNRAITAIHTLGVTFKQKLITIIKNTQVSVDKKNPQLVSQTVDITLNYFINTLKGDIRARKATQNIKDNSDQKCFNTTMEKVLEKINAKKSRNRKKAGKEKSTKKTLKINELSSNK